jgi:ubiquinone/menaquinone biosynthesis C-methylase UbiE
MKLRKLSNKSFDYQAEREYYKIFPAVVKDCDYIAPYYKSFLGEFSHHFKNRRVLDIGAGECVHGQYIGKTCSPQCYVNLDLFPDRMRLACQNNKMKNNQFINGDSFSLPIRAESVDVVWGNGFLFRMRPLEKIAKEIFRVLRPGGVYLGIEPDFANPLVLLRFSLMSRDNKNDGALYPRLARIAFSSSGLHLRYRFFWKRIPWLQNSFLSTSMGLIGSKPL